MSVREELFAWLAERPVWQQDLARRLSVETELNDEAFDDALATVQDAYGALVGREPPTTVRALALEDLPGVSGARGQSPRLLRFGNLRGLGMATENQHLQFAEAGLTVVYGPNAAGKTTYVRGLKRVCRTVDRDSAVRGNVFVAPEPGAPRPSASVEYRLGGELHAQQINLTAPPDLGLGDVSVFDSRCAELYVDSRNSIAYVPSSLLLLARLAATQDRMRAVMGDTIAQLQRTRPAFPELQGESVAKQRVEGLAAGTDLEELAQFSTLDEQETARQKELRAIIAAAATRSAHSDAQAAHVDATETEALAARMRDLASRLTGPAVTALRALADTERQTRDAVALAAKEFADLPVSSVGGEPWQQLWRSARAFNEQRDAAFPPVEGEPCPLCQQDVPAETAAKMAHFEAHVQSSLQADADTAKAVLTTALERLEDTHVEACRTPLLRGLKEREPELYEALESYLAHVGMQMRALRADPGGAQTLPVLEDAVNKLESWGRARGAHATALVTATDPKGESELRSELHALDGREAVAARFSDIGVWVDTLTRIDALTAAHQALATNKLTSLQREMSDGLVTDALGGRLSDELRHLGCEHLPIDLQPRTVVGETQILLHLAGAHGAPPVAEILSEGEQRAVSLAFFFAEIGGAEHDGGLIVDDPVSSLDDERRAYIARRLVEESTQRQVVVLTHDLAFLLDLSDHAEAAGNEPMIQGMWRLGDEVGRVDDHPPFTAMKLKQRVGSLDQKIAQWDQTEPRDYDEAWRRVCDMYDEMRKTWERAIEERPFRGVVQRLQREVKTLKLKDVSIKAEQIATITEGMTRCSYFVHDAAPATGTSLPGRQELAADLEKLRNFERETRP